MFVLVCGETISAFYDVLWSSLLCTYSSGLPSNINRFNDAAVKI